MRRPLVDRKKPLPMERPVGLFPPNDAGKLWPKGVDFALSLADQEKHDPALPAMHHARTHFYQGADDFLRLCWSICELAGDRNGR